MLYLLLILGGFLQISDQAAMGVQNTTLTISNMSIENNGALAWDSTSLLSSYGTNTIPVTPTSPRIIVQTGTLTIEGEDTAKISSVDIREGNLDITSNYIHIGAVIGEKEDYAVRSSTQEGVLAIRSLNSPVSLKIGLAYQQSPQNEVLIERRYASLFNPSTQTYSQAYYYELSPTAVMAKNISFALYGNKGKEINDLSLFAYDTAWQNIALDAVTGIEKVPVYTCASPATFSRLALFAFPPLDFPKVITPNNDGINDCFEIKGIEKFPRNFLTIYDLRGNARFKKENYTNDFIPDLPHGTYYYHFKLGESKKIFRGSFEILRR